MFPLTIKYKSHIDWVLDNDSRTKIFDCIKKELTYQKVDYQFIEGNRFNFHSSMFKFLSVFEPMSTTEGGYFEIIKYENHLILICRVSNYRLLFFTLLFGLIAGLLSMDILTGTIVFGLTFFIELVFSFLIYLGFFAEVIKSIKSEIILNNGTR
jgi:hypothetical protein